MRIAFPNLWAFLVLLGCLFSSPAMADSAFLSERELMAKMLIALPHYIETDLATTRRPTLCVEGSHEVALIARSMNDPLKSYAKVTEEINPSCDVIYSGQRQQARRAIVRTSGQSLVVVSSYATFVDEGGMVGFVAKKGVIQIELNISAAKERRIRFSPDLIELSARVVQ